MRIWNRAADHVWILWKDVGGVFGRWADSEKLAIAILLVFTGPSPRYQLVSAELVPTVTVEDLEAAIAPGNRGVVQVQAEVKTHRCTCADEALYTVKMESSSSTTVYGPCQGRTPNITPTTSGRRTLAPRSPRNRAGTPTTGRTACDTPSKTRPMSSTSLRRIGTLGTPGMARCTVSAAP
jgi:hypothetical protein